jgi:hypothetical protein
MQSRPAELMHRIFALDLLRCPSWGPRCNGTLSRPFAWPAGEGQPGESGRNRFDDEVSLPTPSCSNAVNEGLTAP